MKTIFLKNTALMVTIIGLLIIFQTLGSTQDLGMIEVFFLLIGTAIPLTIGKTIWDLTKNIEDDYVIKKIDKKDVKELKSNETFKLMQEYSEEMNEESELSDEEEDL